MESAQPPVLPNSRFHRFALPLKIGGICFLILLLLVPLEMADGVLKERMQYRDETVAQIASVWGGRQTVTGPVLAVPYTYRGQVTRTKMVNGNAVQIDETATCTSTAYFLPEVLNVAGTVQPETRHRGIYEATLYSASLKLAGHFVPGFAAAGIQADTIQWDEARILFGVTDPKGIRSVSAIDLGEKRTTEFENAGAAGLTFRSEATEAWQYRSDSDVVSRAGTTVRTAPAVTTRSEGLSLGAKLTGVADGKRLDFEFTAALQGCGGLQVAPVGKSTTVKISAPWADPSFSGASLPSNWTKGFEAEWQSTQFSRSFGQAWTSRQTSAPVALTGIASSAFGVDFARPVDGYRLAERAQKYGVLFFVLVFAVFFLFEVTAPLRIHPLQYAMVGAALCLFFLAFLALSEFLPTGVAYGIAAAACTALVSFYALSVLKSGRRTSVIAGGLAATYGYLYFVLKSQDYALIAGTVALFAALALVMFCTRRINWYSIEMNTAAAGGVK